MICYLITSTIWLVCYLAFTYSGWSFQDENNSNQGDDDDPELLLDPFFDLGKTHSDLLSNGVSDITATTILSNLTTNKSKNNEDINITKSEQPKGQSYQEIDQEQNESSNPWSIQSIHDNLVIHDTLSIVFIGSNGVGKTTSISKVVNWFQQKFPRLQYSMIAADSFRSGAIEQLKLHGSVLNVPVFAREYARDPVKIVQEGMYRATHPQQPKKKDDIVFIDTAGRFPTPSNLVNLCNLINSCRPYLIVYIADSLAGNSTIPMLKSFNEAIQRQCNGRSIDSVIASKVDTISEKKGILINIPVETKIPIHFIGTGQNYCDLKPWTSILF